MKDKRSKLQIKLAAVKRLAMWHFLNKRLQLVLLSEFPKSGGSWFGQMLSDAIGIPFPRNKSPKFECCVLHAHFVYHSNFNKVICVMRDGRDIMVSAYYHFLFEHNRNPSFSVQQWRNKLPFKDYDDIRTNLPSFIEYMFTKYTVNGSVVTWSDFVNDYFDNPNTVIVKYEDLLVDAAGELDKTIFFLGREKVDRTRLNEIIENYSFKKLSKRAPGEENKKSFLRKGVAGDWKNNFSKESCLMFEKYAGKELLAAGYESDSSWIKRYLAIESN